MSIGVEPETGTTPTVAEPRPASDDLPVTVIEPRSGWRIIDFRELWRARELLAFLVWRDIKIRYKQTAIGAAWAVLQPLAMVAGLTFALGRIASAPDAVVPYWLFVLTGMLPWLLFTGSVNQAAMSVINNHQLVTKVYFPRLLLPLSAVGLAIIDFCVGALVLAVSLPIAGITPTSGLLLVPVALAVLVAAARGLGLGLSALTVRYRDVRVLLPLASHLVMFLTPGLFLQ